MADKPATVRRDRIGRKAPDQVSWTIGHFSDFSKLGPPFVSYLTRYLRRYGVRLAFRLKSVELRTLSSAHTFAAKWIFPVLWISGFGFATVTLWLSHAGNSTSYDPRLQFLIVWIIGTLFILLGIARVKRVRVDSENIYISNYLREVAIPIANISDVTENRWMNWHPVTVHFLAPTAFGSSVVFMPKVRWLGLWFSHPVVAELKELARLANAH